MLNTRAVRGWHQMLTNQGLIATAHVAKERLLARLKRKAPAREIAEAPSDPAGGQFAEQAHEQRFHASATHPFDAQYGVETSGLIWGEHLASGSRNDRWSTAYYGIAPSIFEAVLAEIRSSLPGAAFVDMGSGKGRAVMLATRYPFAEVFGVELSPELHAVASTNLDLFRRKAVVGPQVHLLCKDAADFDFPLQPLVLFFYHPFCKPVLETVLRRLEQSLRAHPRAAHVVYINTELREVLDRTPYLARTFTRTLAMSQEDQMADRIGSSVEECAIYMSTLEA